MLWDLLKSFSVKELFWSVGTERYLQRIPHKRPLPVSIRVDRMSGHQSLRHSTPRCRDDVLELCIQLYCFKLAWLINVLQAKVNVHCQCKMTYVYFQCSLAQPLPHVRIQWPVSKLRSLSILNAPCHDLCTMPKFRRALSKERSSWRYKCRSAETNRPDADSDWKKV